MQWSTPLIYTLGLLRQDSCHELKTCLIQSLKLWSEGPLGSHNECGG